MATVCEWAGWVTLMLTYFYANKVSSTAHFKMVRLEQLTVVPDNWHLLREPSPSTRIQLRIALHQQNVAAFEQAVIDLSTPGHPKYGQHMKREQVKSMLRPTNAAINGVLGWLESEGVPNSDLLHESDWIHFNITVARAEKMLDTKFAWYHNDVDGAVRLRTLGYSVPEKLRKHIDMIQPTTRFGQMRAQRSTIIDFGFVNKKADKKSKWISDGTLGSFNFSVCNATLGTRAPQITAQCLRHLYSLPDGQPGSSSAKNSKFGICGYLEEYAKYDALATFLAEYAPYAVGTNFSVVSVNGGLNDQADVIDNDFEANLDIQYGVALGYPVPVTYYSTSGRGVVVPDLLSPLGSSNTNEPYLDFLHYILALPDDQLPQTLSTSYGEDEQSIPLAYTISTCNMFAQLGARGVSVLFSSGDSGVGLGCQLNDGSNQTRFLPQFPACCPFVTSVGGTFGVFPEQAAPFSSGGFSERFTRPDYQKDAVTDYLSRLGSQWNGLYNPYGRAFPDVAAQGLHFNLIDQGNESFVSGTSASAPVFSAVIALLNDALLAQGRPVLGFLNPWLYSSGKDGLTDIVDGGSNGCGSNDTETANGPVTPLVPFASWNATPGWDPVTGLGTPNYGKLLQLVLRSTGQPVYEG